MAKVIDVKESLGEAIVEATRRKPFEKITVADILETSGVSRRTFYNHFMDKYDLMAWVYIHREEKILSRFYKGDPWKQCMALTYEGLKENADFFLSIIDHNGQNSFYQQFYTHTYAFMEQIILSRLGTDALPEDIAYALTTHVFGQVNCAVKWLREGMKASTDQMAQYNVDNMPAVLQPFFLDP